VATESPFADVRVALGVAGVGVTAAAGWALAALTPRGVLPGGRWLVVHLLTLGVITPLALTFSQHFARTLTRSPAPATPLAVPAAVGALLVLTGLTSGRTWGVALGGTLVTALAVDASRRLRRMRRQAVGARFAWIVRIYERAHGALVHGAVLGIAMGTGLLPGDWYAAVRLAHVHTTVLGWAGLTLLATLVFFGPSMSRAQIGDGAEDRAAPALRRGATALSAAVLLLVLTALDGPAGTAARLLAAGALGVLAWGVTVVCRDVGRSSSLTRRSGVWGLVLGVCVWFPLVVWADVLVVATGRWALLTPVGVAALVGVLLPAVLATAAHVGPLQRSRDARIEVSDRVARGAAPRAVGWALGAVLVVTAASGVAGGAGAVVARCGWGLLAVVAVTTAGQVVRPVRGVVRTG
jgi:nitrite reductase (NO-forming)